MRALVVDDSRAMRTILRRLLIESGYTEVTEVADIRSARVSAADNPPHVVIVDWQLPDGDALELVSRLRSEGETATMMVLAPGSAEDATSQALAAGADDCVAKPFTGDDLRRRLSGYLAA